MLRPIVRLLFALIAAAQTACTGDSGIDAVAPPPPSSPTAAPLTGATNYRFAGDPGDMLGSSVAVSGDGKLLAVRSARLSSPSVRRALVPSTSSVRRARRGPKRRTSCRFKAPKLQGGHDFGVAVRLSHDGTTFAVGARDEASKATLVNSDRADNSKNAAGAVYLY